jgi:hypothetical protein
MSKAVLLSFFALSLAACDSIGRGAGDAGDNPADPNGGPGGSATGGSDDGGPGSIDPGVYNPDMNCGGMAFAIQRVPPNVMLILDRSGSMSDPIDANSLTSKWQDLQSAMDSVLTQYDPQIRFGADLFADPNSFDSCAPGPIAVPVGPNHGAMIRSALNGASPGSATPTAATFDLVIQGGMLNDPQRDNYVVVVTDGMPNCGDTDVASRIAMLYAAKPSVKTYVIGVGSDTASDPVTLNSWAVAGHTDKQGQTSYYQANSPQDLQAAFNTIAGGVVSCTFHMAQKPPDPMQLYVWSNGKAVPADPNNGYTYDASGPTVTLHGAACNLLRNNPNTKIQVEYGCPNPPGVM